MLTLEGVTPPPRRGRAARAVGFVRPWLFGLAASMYVFAIGWTRWKHRATIVEICSRMGYRYDSREPTELPVVPIESAAPPAAIDVRAIAALDGNVSERELVVICRLVRVAAPRAVFEFGTFDGRTTLNIAANVGASAQVHTLDLPREHIQAAAAPIHAHEVRYADKPESGERFAGTDVEHRITQHLGDSGTFDFTPFAGSIDLVFVDGSHTWEYVVNDSLHALRMLRGGKGTIVWHDYGRWDGVTRALNDLRRTRPEFSELRWVEGTTLALLRL